MSFPSLLGILSLRLVGLRPSDSPVIILQYKTEFDHPCIQCTDPTTCFLPCCNALYLWEYLDRIPSRSNRDGPQTVSRYRLRHVHILGLGQIMLRRMRVKTSEFERRRQYSFLAGAESLTLPGIRTSVLVVTPESSTVSKPSLVPPRILPNVGRTTEYAGF
ncbi:hypothetical protein EDB87DRAFT_1415217 [Lactarius vividus]|nr:hypothetical protein EDB87DRAFT_1415217 [Lactarius vividus]